MSTRIHETYHEVSFKSTYRGRCKCKSRKNYVIISVQPGWPSLLHLSSCHSHYYVFKAVFMTWLVWSINILDNDWQYQEIQYELLKNKSPSCGRHPGYASCCSLLFITELQECVIVSSRSSKEFHLLCVLYLCSHVHLSTLRGDSLSLFPFLM